MIPRLRKLLTGQFLRYLVVGLWNTVFGYACFALFTKLLDKVIPQSYLAGSLLSNMVSITVAFLGYKWFVFKTRGNYLKEWLRCVGVYSGSIALGLFLLPIMVLTIRHKFGYQTEAPYIAGCPTHRDNRHPELLRAQTHLFPIVAFCRERRNQRCVNSMRARSDNCLSAAYSGEADRDSGTMPISVPGPWRAVAPAVEVVFQD